MRDHRSNKKSDTTESSYTQSISPTIGPRKQFASFLLFASFMILVALCPFNEPIKSNHKDKPTICSSTISTYKAAGLINDESSQLDVLKYIHECLGFIKLIFTNTIRVINRSNGLIQADAAMLGKVAKVWYVKKKIKKLGKRLKKHTIAVPVFTSIPIYEHSYYPQPYVTHVSHNNGYGNGHEHQIAPSSLSSTRATATEQIATSASNTHYQTAHQVPATFRSHHPPLYHPHAAHQIINNYRPSPPLYVDEAGGLYGQYGNAYGRYDGGYHVW